MDFKEAIKYIGKRISNERKDQGLTQKELAIKAQVGEKVIGKIEQFKANPTLKTLDKIARALGLKIEDICPTKRGLITIDYEALKKLKRREL